MRYAPNKIFMLENGQYIEISYEYYQRLVEENSMRRFWLFGGMLMEVSEEDYIQMNREKSRMQYQFKMAAKLGEFSYDSISTDEFDGALILEDHSPDVCEIVENQLMVEQLREVMKRLSKEETELIQALYFRDYSEKTYGEKLGISQVAVHKRKKNGLEKLRKLMQ